MSTPSTPGPDAPLRAALRYGLMGLAVLVVVSAILSSIIAGMPGLWGALLGAAIGGGFILTTAASVLFSAKIESGLQGIVILGSWVGKIVLVLAIVAVLKQFDFYSPVALFLTVVGALLIVLGAETYGLLRQRVPTVETEREL
ncbi:hypothetical protein GFY24_16110 [Nocardia sp. SYP-A9097]|uniref:hypothetical protein n=1 Tax=Nocardia sp. SYP-A9097 TaxID=2663237 RepID=UPI00132193B3|nr:hypothetical protein [Nocardia sp. SYP-A9097]MRH88951.1 hypothetical protein [Nocardia sp. SYP-A9097]